VFNFFHVVWSGLWDGSVGGEAGSGRGMDVGVVELGVRFAVRSAVGAQSGRGLMGEAREMCCVVVETINMSILNSTEITSGFSYC